MLTALLTLTWGFNWSVMKIGVSELPPLWFRWLSVLIGTLVLGAILAIRGKSIRMARDTAVRVLLLSIPNSIVWYAAVTIALTTMPAGRAAILAFTMPAWSALIGVAVYRERPDGRVFAAVVCAVAGVVLLVAGDWNTMTAHPAGVALLLFASVAWAWGTHLLKRSTIEIDHSVLTFWMLAYTCPVMLAGSALFEASLWRVPVGIEWLPILYNAILVLAIGNLIWFTIARTLPPTTAGLSSMLIPVVGVFSGMVALGERPTWRDFAALALISTAVIAALLPRPHETARS